MKLNNYLNETSVFKPLDIKSLFTKEKLDRMGIEKYTINADGTVDVDGNVELSYRDLTEIPIKFGKVNGNFSVPFNRLTTLKNAPKIVEGFFWVGHNRLTSLKGAPKIVEYWFSCEDNKVKFTKNDIAKFTDVKGHSYI